jgi:hypothetical protein
MLVALRPLVAGPRRCIDNGYGAARVLGALVCDNAPCGALLPGGAGSGSLNFVAAAIACTAIACGSEGATGAGAPNATSDTDATSQDAAADHSTLDSNRDEQPAEIGTSMSDTSDSSFGCPDVVTGAPCFPPAAMCTYASDGKSVACTCSTRVQGPDYWLCRDEQPAESGTTSSDAADSSVGCPDAPCSAYGAMCTYVSGGKVMVCTCSPQVQGLGRWTCQ